MVSEKIIKDIGLFLLFFLKLFVFHSLKFLRLYLTRRIMKISMPLIVYDVVTFLLNKIDLVSNVVLAATVNLTPHRLSLLSLI
jgi:hypothetical protein